MLERVTNFLVPTRFPEYGLTFSTAEGIALAIAACVKEKGEKRETLTFRGAAQQQNI